MASETKARVHSTSWTAGSSFAASALAEIVTLPIDVTKVRLQVQTVAVGATPQYTGMVDTMVKIVRNEGASGLFKGLAPALMRQCCYTSIVMALFPHIKGSLCKDGEDPGFVKRLIAGGTAGGIGIAIMNPAEILKTQMQTAVSGRSMFQVAQNVYKTEGILGFWAGVKPNVLRCFLVNAAEIGTYDHAKYEIQSRGILSDWPAVQHVMASGIAGFNSAIISTPADVVKTRLMNQAGATHAYDGMLDAIVSIPRQEGFAALYKGFLPILARKLVWCSVFFVAYEKILVLEPV
eukprot:m.157254 g.157254  ORF g.157254 m.157254 type:complete len:292 (-) comp31045_c0_seq1:328-1203(-)